MSLPYSFSLGVTEPNVILLVEDEPFIAIDMEEALMAAGYPVESRSSRSDAMQWLQSNNPSIAILDIHLKDGDGTEIALHLRDRGIPVIFCSGGSPADLPADFRAAAWVGKPFTEEKLVGAIRDALEQREFLQQVEASA